VQAHYLMMKKSKKRIAPDLKNDNLDRFAGSSDEEDEEKPKISHAPSTEVIDSRSDSDEEDGNDNDNVSDDEIDDEVRHGGKHLNDEGRHQNVGNDESDDLSSVEGEESDRGTKMANAMSNILGTSSTTKSKKGALSTSVVLAKTVTPLQKLQQKEKEQRKAMKEKRQANRERNLTALHLPLSVATANNIDAGGKLSVAKELEQERFHRRVATRGVVALFNAITQHQRNTVNDNHDSNAPTKKKEISKMTKHGFLDKIKAAAKTKGSEESKEAEISKSGKNLNAVQGTNRSSWDALQDDYMLNPKKNWDEESSEEEPSDVDGKVGKDEEQSKSRKKRRTSRNQ